MHVMGPGHWTKIKLEQSVLFKKGKKPNILEAEKFNGAIPYINIEAFETGNIKQYADIKSSNICKKGDILVVWDGARFGLTGTNQEGAIGSTIMCLTPIEIKSEFLFKFIQSKYPEIQQNPKGTGIPHVNPEVFWNFQVPLPPLTEQQRIVEKLDAILPRVKAARARLEKIPVLLKHFRQSVLTAACSGKLTEEWRENHAGKLVNIININEIKNHTLEIPNDWKVLLAKDACENIECGSTPKGKPFSLNGEVPFLKVYNIVNQKIAFDYKPQFVSSDIHNKELSRSKCYPYNILMNIVGPPLGKIAIVTNQFPEWNINQAIVVFRPGEFIDYRFLYFLLCSEEPIRKIINETRGSAGQANISLTQCRNLIIPVPSLKEQHEIVRRVEKLFALADSLEAKFNTAMQRIEKIEQSVLAKAFRGELVPQDPNDEPAVELLKRILEEKRKVVNKSAKTKRK